MGHQRLGNIVAGVTAVLIIVTACLHTAALGQINQPAQTTSADVRPLLTLLWITFGLELAIVGSSWGIVARDARGGGRLILIAASLCPLSAAALQVVYLGFIPPTAILALHCHDGFRFVGVERTSSR